MCINYNFQGRVEAASQPARLIDNPIKNEFGLMKSAWLNVPIEQMQC